MKSTSFFLVPALLLAGSGLSWAGSPCHDVDMYGIYVVCGSPDIPRREDRRPAVDQPVSVVVTQPIETPIPDFQSAAAPENDSLHRELTAVDARLHALHLLLNDKQTRGEIEENFAGEEARYLTQIEQREQSAADTNGGYLTVAQEISLLQQLQDVENEINNNISTNG